MRSVRFSSDMSAKVPPKCHQNEKANERLSAFAFKLLILLKFLVALPGLEPGLFALRGRRVNQLHHNAMIATGGSTLRRKLEYTSENRRTQNASPAKRGFDPYSPSFLTSSL
jgi:hypothetical protein